MFSNQTLQKPLNENIMDKAKSGTVIKDNAPLYMQSLKEKSGLDNNEIQIALDEKERQVSDDIMKDPPSKSEYDDIQEEITMQAYNQVKDDFENGRINGEDQDAISPEDMTNLDAFDNPTNDQGLSDFGITTPELQDEVDQIMSDINTINNSEEFAEPEENSPMLGFDELDKLAEPEDKDNGFDFPAPEFDDTDGKDTDIPMPNDSTKD